MLGWVGLLVTILFQVIRITIELVVLAARATVWLVREVVVPLVVLSAEAAVSLAAAIAHRAEIRRTGR